MKNLSLSSRPSSATALITPEPVQPHQARPAATPASTPAGLAVPNRSSSATAAATMTDQSRRRSTLPFDREPPAPQESLGTASPSDDERSEDEIVAEALAFRGRLLLPALGDESARLTSGRSMSHAAHTDQSVPDIVDEALALTVGVQSRAAGGQAAKPQGPGHEAYATMRSAHFRTMAELITQLMLKGGIVLGEEDVRQLGHLKSAARQLDEHAQGGLPCPPQRQAVHDHILGRVAGEASADQNTLDRLRAYELGQTEHSARRALATVLQGRLPAVLAEVRDTGTLYQLAQDLLVELRRTIGPKAMTASPAFARAQAQALQSIQREVQLAGAESELQKDLLQTLGLAAAELGQAKVHGLRGGLNHAARTLLGHEAVHLAGGDHRPRAEQVRASLEGHLGEFFSFDHTGKDVHATLMEDVPGSLSTTDFEHRLSELLHVKEPKLVAQMVHQAVDLSPDYERVRVKGQDAVRLKPHTLDRLADLGRADAPAATPQEQAAHRSLLQGLALAAQDQLHSVLETVLHIRRDPDTSHVHAEARDEWAQRHPDELISHLNQQLRTHRAAGDHTAVALLEGVLRDNVHLKAARDTDDGSLHVWRHGAPPLPDTPPRERLVDMATKAQQVTQTAVLKLSLLQSFDGLIKVRAGSSDESVPSHRDLRLAKDELLAETLDGLMACATRDQMIEHVTEAQARHEALWRDTWKRPHGGRTDGLLKDLRAAVERF